MLVATSACDSPASTRRTASRRISSSTAWSRLRASRELSINVMRLHTQERLSIFRKGEYVHLKALVLKVFKEKQITRAGGTALLNNDQALFYAVVQALRAEQVLEVEGEKRAAKYVLTDTWAYKDHE